MNILEELYEVILDRIKNPKEDSFTSRISVSEEKIKEKIREESEEILNYTDRDNLIWEIADLTYFLMILMVKKGISLDEVGKELIRRRR